MASAYLRLVLASPLAAPRASDSGPGVIEPSPNNVNRPPPQKPAHLTDRRRFVTVNRSSRRDCNIKPTLRHRVDGHEPRHMAAQPSAAKPGRTAKRKPLPCDD